MIKLFTLHIHCTDSIKTENDAKSVVQILFGGEAEGEYFNGVVLPGGVDTQKYDRKLGTGTISARYTLKGTDRTGAECLIFVENNAKAGESETVPTLMTDSEELKWICDAEAKGKLSILPEEVLIEIFVQEA